MQSSHQPTHLFSFVSQQSIPLVTAIILKQNNKHCTTLFYFKAILHCAWCDIRDKFFLLLIQDIFILYSSDAQHNTVQSSIMTGDWFTTSWHVPCCRWSSTTTKYDVLTSTHGPGYPFSILSNPGETKGRVSSDRTAEKTVKVCIGQNKEQSGSHKLPPWSCGHHLPILNKWVFFYW